MSVMLGDMAVTAVVKYINGQRIGSPVKDDELGRCCVPLVAYKYEKPEKIKGEYIAVNHLPFIHRNVVGEGVVNINIHVPKLKSGLPNTKRLAKLVQTIVNLFPEDKTMGNAYYEFLSDSRPTPDNDDTYFVNIQINVTFINLLNNE